MSTLTTSIQHGIKALSSQRIRHETEIQGTRIGKEEVKLSLFAGDVITCVSAPVSVGG